MSVRLLFGVGCVIVLAGLAMSALVERYASGPHSGRVAPARVAKGVTYFGVVVAAFAMISGLIIG